MNLTLTQPGPDRQTDTAFYSYRFMKTELNPQFSIFRFDGVWVHLSLSTLCGQERSLGQGGRPETMVRDNLLL